jgi:plasmid stabilization system protein ParE
MPPLSPTPPNPSGTCEDVYLARAEAWLDGVLAAIDTLTSLPRRCPLAPENDEFDVEVRQLLYGEHRILFTVEDDVVRVLHVLHGARRFLTPDEVE